MAASTTPPNGKPSRPLQAGQVIDTMTLQADGSAALGNGLVVSNAGVQSLLQQLAGQKMIVILPADQGGLPTFNDGIHGLVTAVNAKQYGQTPVFVAKVLRGLHDMAGIGTPNMTAPTKTPAQEGLVDCGHGAVQVLTQYPNASYNALVRLDVGQLGAQTGSLDLHTQLGGVYGSATTRVNLGIGYLSELVCDSSRLVYDAIQPGLEVDEDLERVAKPLTSYFDDPVAKGLQTKKLLKKQKAKVTNDVAADVKDQAVQQAKQELQSEINAKVGPIFSGSGGNNGSGGGNT